MAYIYAELDENGRCKAVSKLSGEVIKDTMIRINEYDTSLLGMKYNNGTWEEVPMEENAVAAEPSQLDRIEAALNTSKEQTEQQAIDAYTLELIESGVL